MFALKVIVSKVEATVKEMRVEREVDLTVDGLKISGGLYFPKNGKAPYPAVVLCHGIPSGMVDPADGGYPLLAKTMADKGFAAFTFSFRGGVAGNFDIAGWTTTWKPS
jgi:dipeptidyl aminopeptidase/acylaminoacyl peptidase